MSQSAADTRFPEESLANLHYTLLTHFNRQLAPFPNPLTSIYPVGCSEIAAPPLPRPEVTFRQPLRGRRAERGIRAVNL